MRVWEQDLVVIRAVCVIAGQGTTDIIAISLLKIDICYKTSCGILNSSITLLFTGMFSAKLK